MNDILATFVVVHVPIFELKEEAPSNIYDISVTDEVFQSPIAPPVKEEAPENI
jgi:hypothetical protein